MQPEDIITLIKNGAKSWNTWRAKLTNDLPCLDGVVCDSLTLDGIDFSGVSMRNAKITNCSLKNAKFISANLGHANLQGNDFSGAKLIASGLENANLSRSNLYRASILTASTKGAKLENIDFRGHDLSSLNLSGASLAGSNLEWQDFSNADLSNINFENANLAKCNLSHANLSRANLSGANLKGAKLQGALFRVATLLKVDFRAMNLSEIDFKNADLRDCDFREAELQKVCLSGADITGCKFWRTKTNNWDISNVTCKHAYWNELGDEKTKYKTREFERIYGSTINVVLNYPYRITSNELTTLPILIDHLQANHWGIVLRLKSIADIAGGSRVTLAVDEIGKHNPSVLAEELNSEASRIQLAQLVLRSDVSLQNALKEEVAGIKEKFWPRLLELAAEHEREQIRNLTVVFMDLKDFSQWTDDELGEKLNFFRGLIKPVLKKWRASYPNMEGDSLRVTFRNATAGLACACTMRSVLTSAGFEVRIGVELGEVAMVHNEVTDISDLEGTAVSMAARLEAVAQPGSVLVTERVRHYTDYKGLFHFSPQRVKLGKNIGTKKAGDVVECYAVDLIKPILDTNI